MVGSYISPSGENAMTTVWRFLAKFASLIVCTLHCFDRVIFKGHMALSAPKEFECFVDYILKVRRSHFMNILAPDFLDSQLGLIHVRLQTWAPFTLQVYVNGHDWLAQQLIRLGVGFVQQHNAFTQLDDPAKAQRQADRFAKLNWTTIACWARGSSIA
jgi:hypothetical protein